MNHWLWIGLAIVIVLFVVWRLNIRRQGTWVDLPSHANAYVNPERAPLVNWLAKKAESQIGRGLNITGSAFAMSTLSDEVESALAAQKEGGSIEINIPAFVGDRDGMYDFKVTVEREELKQFDL
ncbi:MAG: hypothetical protein JRF72_01810 [Deltaproteobacteria bacterium]|jgi:hypothetical protein|nr:hypothetical protein [Deltaproteobacteria bacterium]